MDGWEIPDSTPDTTINSENVTYGPASYTCKTPWGNASGWSTEMPSFTFLVNR